MHFRKRLVHVTFAIVVFAAPVARSDDQHPKSLLGFLRPEMSVGVLPTNGDAAVSINVYSDEQFAITKDARKLTLDQLIKKYAAVGKQVQQAELKASESMTNTGKKEDAAAIVPKVHLLPSPERLGVVKHVGDDYILIADENQDSEIRAIAAKYVSCITLNSSGAHLVTTIGGRVVRTP